MQLKIEYLSKNDLKPYVNNAKIHTSRQVEQIKNSIEEFDFNDPIAVWGENEIVEGHGRLLAAMEMEGLDEVPVIRLDHLSDKQRKAYALAHNKLTMNTDFDIDILAKEVADFGDVLDLTDFGFNEAELLDLEFEIDASPDEEPLPAKGDNEGASGGFSDALAREAGEYSAPQRDGRTYEYEPVSDEDLRRYEERANTSSVITRRVIIIYSGDAEEVFLRELLGIKDGSQIPVICKAGDIMAKVNAEDGGGEPEAE